MTCDSVLPVLEIGFCPPTVENKKHKNYVNFDLSDPFFRPQVFGPLKMSLVLQL